MITKPIFKSILEFFDYKSPNVLNLKYYFILKELITFFNSENDSLIIDLNRKYLFILDLVKKSDDFSSFVKNVDTLNMNVDENLLTWVKNNFNWVKKPEINIGKISHEHEVFKKDFDKTFLNLFNLNANNIKNLHNKGCENLFIIGNLFSLQNSNNDLGIKNLPIVVFPIKLELKNNFFHIHKSGNLLINPYWINNSLLKKEFGLNDYITFENYDDLMKKIFNDLSIDGTLNNIISNSKLKIYPNFYIVNSDFLNIENFFNNKLPDNKLKVANFDVAAEYEKIFLQKKFNFEKKILTIDSGKFSLHNSELYLSKDKIKMLFFEHLLQNKSILFISSQFNLLNDFIKENDLLSLLILPNIWKTQFKNFYNHLNLFFKKLFEYFNTNNEIENYNTTLNNFDVKIKIFSDLSNIQSINYLSIPRTIELIYERKNLKEFNATSLLYNYAKKHNLSMFNLIEKIQTIYQLNIDYEDFLNKYGYEDFYLNIDKHREFLIEYDEPSVVKVLSYFEFYIENKMFPMKNKFFTHSNLKTDQKYLTNIYNLFFQAIDKDLFYIPKDELDKLISLVIDEENFTSHANEEWLNQYSSEFIKYKKSDLYDFNENLDSKNLEKKVSKNIEVLIHNFFVNLVNKIKTWNKEKILLLKKLRESLNFSLNIPPEYFIEKNIKILIELFPIWISDFSLNEVNEFSIENLDFDVIFLNIIEKFNFENLHNSCYSNKKMIYFFNNNKNYNHKIESFLLQKNIEDLPIKFNLNCNCEFISSLVNENKIFSKSKKSNLCINKIYVDSLKEVKFDANLNNVNEADFLLKHLNDYFSLDENINKNVTILLMNEKIRINFISQLYKRTRLFNFFENGIIKILTLDDFVDHSIDYLIIALNDVVGNIFYRNQKNSFILKDDFSFNLSRFINRSPNELRLIYSFTPKEINNINNKNSQKLIRNIIDSEHIKNEINKNIINIERSKLFVSCQEWLIDFLSNNIENKKYKTIISDFFDKKNTNILIFDSNDDIRLIINIIDPSHSSFDEQYEKNIYLKKQNYPILEIFLYDWIFKKESLQEILSVNLRQLLK